MTLANAHALFCGLKSEPSYLANLTVNDAERQKLMAARIAVRSAIKAAARQIPTRDEYYEESYSRQVSSRRRGAVEVKFMTQGSFAYGTLNLPAKVPTQEIDLDDGMYVPVHFLENGRPALAAKGLFAFVEAALQPLCTANGWRLDTSKVCCVRVKLWPGAHIDLPIYSIPVERYEQIRETLAKSYAADSMTHAYADSVAKLPPDKIMLAQRDGTWVQSDPQQLHDWVEGRGERYGAVYKRLCRFFKGWRDYSWDKSALSSLALMCAVDLALREMDGFPTENRDDELIMEVSKRLPDIFRGEIYNPVLGHLLLNTWSSADRQKFVDAASKLRDEMVSALERTGVANLVVQRLQSQFGQRIPNRPDSIKIASSITAIQRAPAATVAAPRVIQSTSG
jgi:hypothetical protein